MKTLFYVGLEPYEARYTLQLSDWNRRAFEAAGISYVEVPGTTLTTDKAIVTGQVLDAHGRSYFALSQMMWIVAALKEGRLAADDVLYFEDMFHPGIEALPYIFNQTPAACRPKVFVRCLAQTIDPDDFVHVWGMYPWMSKYEHLVNDFVDGVLATNEEMVAHAKIAGWTAPMYNISGLAFSTQEVQSRVSAVPFAARPLRVAFAARWDQEKQPDFFMDVIEYWRSRADLPDVEFVVLTGSSALRSNNPACLERAEAMRASGALTVKTGLSKNAYYENLAASRVLFNCALQDWVSNTVSEADALGTNVVYPAYRSFPEVFANDHTRLYTPWSVEHAVEKIHAALTAPHPKQGRIADWNNATVKRVLSILSGSGEHWRRNSTDYRGHTRHSKY